VADGAGRGVPGGPDEACRHFEIPTDVPFEKLPRRWQNFVIEGEPGYGQDEEHEWPRAWYGVKGYFRWLESRAYQNARPGPALAVPFLHHLPELPRNAVPARNAALSIYD